MTRLTTELPHASARPLRSRVVVGACALVAAAHAWSLRWTCDDAFISFRYAENLAAGRGLVFNVGERVEGYTNFLWTLAIAPAFDLGVSPEAWTMVLGGAAFVATVLLLGALHITFAKRAGVVPLALPLAAALAAVHREWAIFAESGLETSAFTLAVTAGFAVVVWPASIREARRGALAGALFATSVLFRPDGVVFLGAAGLWLALLASRDGWRDRARLLASFAVTAALIVGAHLLFRLRYYGDWFPNTYYAKSADAAWYGQGLRYASLYLLRYPLLALWPLAVLWLWTRPRTSPVRATLLEPVVLASLLAAAHVGWVVRVGGDFMFGRFLVPATPLLLFAIEAAVLAEAERGRRSLALGATAAAAALFVVVPSPIASGLLESGIADEHAFYSPDRVAVIDDRAARVKPVLEDTGARIAFYSAQARFVHRARIETAIESETGLTDAFVARQILPARHRVGHEKKAPPEYLIDVRRAHLAAVEHNPAFDAYVPFVPADLHGVRMQMLHWDPAFVATLRSRGAIVADYPAMLDAVIADLRGMEHERAQREYARARRFYFSVVSDPSRERPFIERLARP